MYESKGDYVVSTSKTGDAHRLISTPSPSQFPPPPNLGIMNVLTHGGEANLDFRGREGPQKRHAIS